MTLQRHQPSIPLLTQDSFTAVTLPDHVDIVIRNDRWRLDANAGCGPDRDGRAVRTRGRFVAVIANADASRRAREPCDPVHRLRSENRWAADAGPPTRAVVYLRRASCWVREPRTVRILARSTSDLAAASTEPSIWALI